MVAQVCNLQAVNSIKEWQCVSGNKVAWNLLSLFTRDEMLCLEISLVAFLHKENYAIGLETLARAFTLSGLIAGVDMLLKAIFVFGFGDPLLIENGKTTHRMKWGLWTIHKLLFPAIYGFILFVHYSKWRDKCLQDLASHPLYTWQHDMLYYMSLFPTLRT
ncbi:hypothetical protein U1Q18_030570, partial [Sarracenia purpurea var. burkii]